MRVDLDLDAGVLASGDELPTKLRDMGMQIVDIAGVVRLVDSIIQARAKPGRIELLKSKGAKAKDGGRPADEQSLSGVCAVAERHFFGRSQLTMMTKIRVLAVISAAQTQKLTGNDNKTAQFRSTEN